jgi:NAD(P)-dependent dehydrogenase (short-subunit alcohol dehydrogenase family)
MGKEYRPLQDKVTLVTGAGGGIGQKICHEFAKLGSHVYMCDIANTQEIADEIFDEVGGICPTPVQCDLSKKEEIMEMMDQIQKEGKGVDILINNAAIKGPAGSKHSFPEIDYEGFKLTIDIDLSAAVHLSLLSLPHMQEQKWGRILFTAAPLSSSGIPAPYLAGKAGFVGLSKHLSAEYKEDGIKTLALALRHTETPMIRRVIASKGIDVEEGLRKMHAKSLTGRMTTPKEIAKLFAYFAVTENPDITGVSLLSDGGITYLR